MAFGEKDDCVAPFLERAADHYAQCERLDVHDRLHDLATEGKFGNSPLEQLFGIAICVQWRASYVFYGVRVAEIEDRTWKWAMSFGEIDSGADDVLLVYPQHRIGRYRADFVIEIERHHPEKTDDGWKTNRWIDAKKKVVVELDGTAFHERTEPERRREKKRDRALQRQGYDVLRYTGKEVMQDPYKVAADVLSHLDGDDDCQPLPEWLSG